MTSPTPSILSVLRHLACGLAVVLHLPAAHAQAAPAELSTQNLSFVRPRIELWPERIEVKGDVMPWQEVRLNAEVGGLRVLRVGVAVGDVVRKGQVLAELDTASVEAELEAVQAQLGEAEAALSQADTTLARARRLVSSGGVSQQELVQYETQKQTAAARVAVARTRVRTQQIKLDAARLIAPDDGVISASAVEEGDIVRAGSELFRLIREGRLEWRAEVPGEALLKLEAGQEVFINSPLGDEVKGRIRRLSPTIDLRTRLGVAYVDLPAETRFKAGLRVSGNLVAQRKALVLPATAIQPGEAGEVVFTLDAANRIKPIRIDIGRSQGDEREVTAAAGATLSSRTRIIANSEGLQAGMQVRDVPAGERSRLAREQP